MNRTCLNGYWDFLPRFESVPTVPRRVPESGWYQAAYLVPSVWTKPSERPVEIDGEKYPYRGKALGYEHDGDFAWDDYRYPAEWNETRSAWIRRCITVSPADLAEHRLFLEFGAVMPRGRLYVNGETAAEHIHPTLPWVVDITELVLPGENEITVLITDYSRDELGRPMVPTGNNIICEHCGIWQDVYLILAAQVRIDDVTVRTSVRRSSISIRADISNDMNTDIEVAIRADCVDWARDADPWSADSIKDFTVNRHLTQTISAHGHAAVTIESSWDAPHLWSPQDPHLYVLRIWLDDLFTEAALDIHCRRFGFREVWIEERDILLNGVPIHLFSDWGHKLNMHSYTEGWIRAWFTMLREANMNHSRLSTHPHPPLFMDLADEEGILLTGETGLHGSGGVQAASSPEFWQAAADHVRRFVKRDKNHPSVILWSVENEMRWNNNADPSELVFVRRELPKLREIFEDEDPTRIAYHEGDSSLWNESEQPIISRHYGKECAGVGWWDGKQPLHAGEMCLYHYSGPNTTLHLGGDAVYASWKSVDLAAGRDLEYIVETGRTLGVCCFGPWNLSCNENLRPERTPAALTYDDFTSPGLKPLYAEPHTSEFAYWTHETYRKSPAFDLQRRAFRQIAVIDTSRRTGYFAGTSFRRSLHIVNDSPKAVAGRLVVRLVRCGKAAATWISDVAPVPQGGRHRLEVSLDIPIDFSPGKAAYEAEFETEAQEIVDRWERKIFIGRRDSSEERPGSGGQAYETSVLLYGRDADQDALSSLGFAAERVYETTAVASSHAKVIVIGEEAITPGSELPSALSSRLEDGACVVILRQTISPFAGRPLFTKPVLTAFVRSYGHPVVTGITDDELQFWGDASYAQQANDGYLADQMYRKDDGSSFRSILDSGEGGFGTGSLDFTPLLEARQKHGLVVACQLRLVDNFDKIPAARKIITNLLWYALSAAEAAVPVSLEQATTAGGEKRQKTHFDGSDPQAIAAAVHVARGGGTALIEGLSPPTLDALNNSLPSGVPRIELVPTPGTFQLVRNGDHELLAGISNEDMCGIEEFSYYKGEHPNVEVIRYALRPVDGLEALAITPTKSCLKELFVDGGKGERTRANTVTRALLHAQREPLVGIGTLAVGSGSLLISQFDPPFELRERFARVRHLLRRTVAPTSATVITDAAVAEPIGSATGYPDQIFVLNRPVDETEQVKIIEATRPSRERMMTFPILNFPGWVKMPAEKGVLHASDIIVGDSSRVNSAEPVDLYLYYFVGSPSPRKNVISDDSVPNPQALTFLDVYGEGTAELFINGRRIDERKLAPSGATFSDLDLEMGYNHILVHWRVSSPEAKISFLWRDIMRQVETELVFHETVND